MRRIAVCESYPATLFTVPHAAAQVAAEVPLCHLQLQGRPIRPCHTLAVEALIFGNMNYVKL
jgi:hypothetical protein